MKIVNLSLCILVLSASFAAESFKDRLRRIVALAAIYQWKAKELEKGTPKTTPAP